MIDCGCDLKGNKETAFLVWFAFFSQLKEFKLLDRKKMRIFKWL